MQGECGQLRYKEMDGMEKSLARWCLMDMKMHHFGKLDAFASYVYVQWLGVVAVWKANMGKRNGRGARKESGKVVNWMVARLAWPWLLLIRERTKAREGESGERECVWGICSNTPFFMCVYFKSNISNLDHQFFLKKNMYPYSFTTFELYTPLWRKYFLNSSKSKNIKFCAVHVYKIFKLMIKVE